MFPAYFLLIFFTDFCSLVWKTVAVAPYVVDYSGALFRQYPGEISIFVAFLEYSTFCFSFYFSLSFFAVFFFICGSLFTAADSLSVYTNILKGFLHWGFNENSNFVNV